MYNSPKNPWGDAMLPETRARLVPTIAIAAVTWVTGIWALLYIHDHLDDPMPVVIQWGASTAHLIAHLVDETSGFILLPLAVGLKAPNKLNYFAMIPFVYLLGSTLMVAEPVAGWYLFGVATLLVMLYATVVVFAAFTKDRDRGDRAHGLVKTMSGSPDSGEPAPETPPESGPSSPGEAPGPA
ncbi:hypothetical protein [Streptomyces cylindrosporus]|uniref:Uncharacterized protein n=1 Tax=Streptomyces cylindrosporus TaxID=2927583 RepID=A0ABS9YI93_9ACTN|nr:hypothetical protein [Streptomyces cylindrosporus]MCI3276972.1 hypothetical protein [Streptomyces cylindrosporus]